MTLTKRMDELDKKYGRSPTFGPHERKLVLDGIVPTWLLLGRKLLANTEMGGRCDQLIKMLERAHIAVAPLVRDNAGVDAGSQE